MKGKSSVEGENSRPEQTRRSRLDLGKSFIVYRRFATSLKRDFFSPEVVALDPNSMNYGAFPCPSPFPTLAKHQRVPTGEMSSEMVPAEI